LVGPTIGCIEVAGDSKPALTAMTLTATASLMMLLLRNMLLILD